MTGIFLPLSLYTYVKGAVSLGRHIMLFNRPESQIRKTDRCFDAHSLLSNGRSSLVPFSWNNQRILSHKRSSCDLSYKWSVWKYDQLEHLSYRYVRIQIFLTSKQVGIPINLQWQFSVFECNPATRVLSGVEISIFVNLGRERRMENI